MVSADWTQERALRRKSAHSLPNGRACDPADCTTFRVAGVDSARCDKIPSNTPARSTHTFECQAADSSHVSTRPATGPSSGPAERQSETAKSRTGWRNSATHRGQIATQGSNDRRKPGNHNSVSCDAQSADYIGSGWRGLARSGCAALRGFWYRINPDGIREQTDLMTTGWSKDAAMHMVIARKWLGLTGAAQALAAPHKSACPVTRTIGRTRPSVTGSRH